MSTAIDQARRARRTRIAFLAITTFIALLDGFDLSIMGVTLPVLLARETWGITALSAGTVASAQLFGMLVGAILSGTLSDRLGKRKVLIATLTLFSTFTLAVVIAPSLTVFIVFRFLAGMGIGGVLLVLVAIVSEFSLPNRRFINNAVMLAGSAVGGLLAALSGSLLLAHVDFRWLWVVPGAIGVLVIPLALVLIPESMAYLQSKGRTQRATDIADRFGVPLPAITEKAVRAPIRTLFAPDLRARTILCLLAAAFVFIMSTAFPTWLPQYLVMGGVELSNALLLVAALSLGATIGPLFGGRLQDRGNARLVVSGYFGASSIALAVIGLAIGAPFALVIALIFVFGAFNTPFLFNGLVANAYPAELRGTILSAVYTVGRTAAIGGAGLGGVVAAAGWHPTFLFLVWALVPLSAAILVFLIPTKNIGTSKPVDNTSSDTAVLQEAPASDARR
ncbi:MFS transporter [Arthrobacter sp. W4I7]|uniref:MFS transporter n=1 Tax=Arthrobacter sp. W4I7 TaxID=3042296 RepID=UPI00278A9B27|nr:MFS transporter [Arthrobacter sp. W4I7]MDQ0691320.1 AAHS family benzoate transporter-like MFS transporter [Arthrobacter sp. W4I7]